MKKTRWYFHLRGQVYGYGPIGPMKKAEAKEYIREYFGNGRRLPCGTQIWKAQDKR